MIHKFREGYIRTGEGRRKRSRESRSVRQENERGLDRDALEDRWESKGRNKENPKGRRLIGSGSKTFQ